METYEEFKLRVLEQIEKGEKLDNEDLVDLVSECEVETTHGENLRWSRYNDTIVSICGRFFSIEWEEGLTEMQENMFDNQPYEVIKKERQITEVTWERIKK